MSNLVTRFDNLKKEIDTTNILHISLKASADKEEQILRGIVKEIKELGFDPKTLKQDLDNLEKEMSDKISAKEDDIAKIKTTLEEIDKNVRSHEV